MNESFSYYAGVAVGVLAVLVVIAFLKRRAMQRGAKPGEYDERQMASRGIAFQRAYITLLLMLLCNALITGIAGVQWGQPGVEAFVCMMVSLAVFVVSCIWRDAYFTVNQTPRRYLWIIGVVVACQIPATVLHAVEGTFVEDGLLTIDIMAPCVMVLFLVVLVTLLIKLRRDRQEAEEE